MNRVVAKNRILESRKLREESTDPRSLSGIQQPLSNGIALILDSGPGSPTLLRGIIISSFWSFWCFVLISCIFCNFCLTNDSLSERLTRPPAHTHTHFLYVRTYVPLDDTHQPILEREFIELLTRLIIQQLTCYQVSDKGECICY